MKKLIYLLFLILFLNGYSQIIPEDYSLDKKEKISLFKSSPTQKGNSISDILIVGDTILLGTNKGLSISYNGGNSWENFYDSEVFGRESVSGLDVRNNIIVVATAHSVEKDGQTLPEGSGIKVSTDFGKTWNSYPQPVDHKDSNKVYYGKNQLKALPITTAVNNLAYDVAITKDAIWITCFAGGLRKSTDLGKTWQRVVIPPDYLNSIKPEDTLNFTLSPVAGNLGLENNLNHRVFSIYAENDSIIWVGTAGGINKSTDGGISWVKFNHKNQTNPISGNFVVAINGTKYNNISHIFAATWKAEDTSEFYAASYTSNGGQSWNTSMESERIHNFGFYQHITYLCGSNGLWRSADFGNTWIKAPTIVDEITGQRIRTNTFYSANSQKDKIWVGSNDGLARTTENYSPWSSPWRVFLAFTPVESKSDAYCYPNPFNPDLETLYIKYTTGGQDAKVTIRIYDFGFNLVRTIIQNATRKGVIDNLIQQTETWDGKNEQKNIVSNGVYFYSIEINDEKPIFGKILLIR